jgi:hypothetical protein
MFIPDPGPWIWIFSIPNPESGSPDPGVKKASDPGSGSATLYLTYDLKLFYVKSEPKSATMRITVSSPFLAEGSSTNANCRCTY